MKKIFAFFLAAVSLLSLGACGKRVTETPPAETPAPVPVEDTAPEVLTFSVTPSAAGKVVYYNPDPDAAGAWEALAADYTAQTGVPVTVVTPSGDYNASLASAFSSADAPTVFCCDRNTPASLIARALDLRNTVIYGELTAPDCVWLDESGRVVAVPCEIENYGVIVNTALLEQAGYSIDYLNSFSHFRVTTNDIHARRDELGFDAMASCGLADDSAPRFTNDLTGVFVYMELLECRAEGRPDKPTDKYMDDYHDTWDLYRQSSAVSFGALNTLTAEESLSEFTGGKAVFYVGNSSEYDRLRSAGLSDEQLVMIPLYALIDGNENAALCRRSGDCWAVDGSAAEDDIYAALDFLAWVVTDEAGLTLLHNVYDYVPFRSALSPERLFAKQDQAMIERGCFPVPMVFNQIPLAADNHAAFLAELRRYTNDPSIYNWYYIALDVLKADWARFYP